MVGGRVKHSRSRAGVICSAPEANATAREIDVFTTVSAQKTGFLASIGVPVRDRLVFEFHPSVIRQGGLRYQFCDIRK